MTIDPGQAEPLYSQLAGLLRRRMEDGTIGPGERLPSQRDLEQEFGVARGTIVKAFALLLDEGLIVNSPGKGHYAKK